MKRLRRACNHEAGASFSWQFRSEAEYRRRNLAGLSQRFIGLGLNKNDGVSRTKPYGVHGRKCLVMIKIIRVNVESGALVEFRCASWHQQAHAKYRDLV